MYCVIVGDIIRSKSLDFETREDDTFAIEKILQQVNTKYASSIMASFGIVRGDAFEGVLFSQQYAPKIIQEIIRAFYEERKLKLRISAVTDELSSVSLDRNKSDGPAFHKAIQEIDKMRESKSDHWFQVSIRTNTTAQPLIESIMMLLTAITRGWTDKQREIAWTMSEVSNQQKLVSQKLGISTTVVNKQLKAANYDAYLASWTNLETYLIDSEETLTNPPENRISYTTYYSIGLHKGELRDYDSAIINYTESIKLAKEEFGDNDLRLVPIYNNLAQAYLRQLLRSDVSKSAKKDALKKAKKAIDASLSCQKDESKMSFIYAQTLIVLGNYYLEVNDWQEALEIFNNAKNIFQEIYGVDHPLLSICDNNIAITFKNQKDYDNAISYYKRCLEVAEKNFEYNPLAYAEYLHNIGVCYEKMEEFETALNYIEKSLEIFVSILPTKHQNIIKEQGVIRRIKEAIKNKNST